MSNRHPKGRLEENWHVEYATNKNTITTRFMSCVVIFLPVCNL